MAGFEARSGPGSRPATLPNRKDFLRARDLDTPEKAAHAAVRVLADWQTQRIKLALGHEFKMTSRVVLRRPLWMPNSVYMWLLRSIVIERLPLEEKSK